MQGILKAALVAALVAYGSAATAGGPVLVEEGNDALVEENTVNSAGLWPVLGILVLACLVACGNKGGSAPEPVKPK